MHGWTRTLLLSMCTAVAAVSAPAVDAQPNDPFFRSLIATEQAFDLKARTQGTQAAYLTYLSADSIMFTYDGTELARPFYEAPGIDWSLEWAPATGEVSRAGDLAYTHGAGNILVPGPNGTQRYGYYSLLLWERDTRGHWRVAMDDSAWAPPRTLPVHVEQRGPAAHPAPPLPSVERNRRLQSVVRADRALVRALMKTPATAYQSVRRADCLFLRDDQTPAYGAAADALLAKYPARPLDSLELVRLSASGDMAFTVGLWPGKGGPGGYTRVWRRDGERWMLVVDSTHYPRTTASTAAPALTR